MSQISTEKIESKISQDIISKTQDNTPPKKERKYSTNSSDSESFISNINAEIKNFLENEENNISFSSNSEQDSPYKKSDIDYLLDSRFWKANNISSYDTEYNQEKKIFGKCLKKNAKKELNESNKQSTQENEDEENRNDIIMPNISSSESGNSPLNTYINNEINENEKKYEKNLENKEQKDKINNNIKNTNSDINNINVSNILLNQTNFTNGINYKNINNYSKFVFPYEHINYMGNQNMPNFFSGTYLAKNYINYNTNYNIPSQIENKTIIPINTNTNSATNNNVSKLSKLLNEKPSNSNQDNKSSSIKDNSQQNSQKISNANYTSQKLNVNMTYNPHIKISSTSSNKQSKTSTENNNKQSQNNSKASSEIKNANNKSNNTTQDKKTKNIESKNSTNNNNKSLNNTNNRKLSEQSFNKNIETSTNNNNNNINFTTKKCEKLFLNLDDIASGKDLRTTIMIRNIPIKYTDNILNETFKEFHGKYDCLYMPYDHEKKGNKGYAFINFVNPLHILLFYEKFNGEKWVHFESSKICELNMAHFQGINEIQKHAKNFKELKKTCFKFNEKIVIPSKYLHKIKKRFPKMKYSENSKKSEFEILSFN